MMVSFSTLSGLHCSTTKKCVSVKGTLTASGKPKEKRRNNEKRKEKSRDAARVRRSCETEIFNSLAEELPLEKEDVKSLDKASIMRIAIAYLKVRKVVQLFSSEKQNFEKSNGTGIDKDIDVLFKNVESSGMLQQTLNGFLLVLTNDGDIAYVTDTIADYLGLSKIDLLGQPIWEYAHQCDHSEIKNTLSLKRFGICDKDKAAETTDKKVNTYSYDIFVRLKSTLTGRRRSVNFKSASYKVMRLSGHLVVSKTGERVLVGICCPIPHPSNIEIPLEPTTFLTKHSMDMKFTHIDDKILNILDYNKEDLLQKSAFDFHHGDDSNSLMATFRSVLSKGQGETCRYRFLGKYGGYCWIVTQATILYEKNQPQSVICVNYVISQLEKNNEIYSLAQYEASKKKFEQKENLQQLPKQFNKSAQTQAQAQDKSTENKNLINVIANQKTNSEETLINEQINKEDKTNIKLKQLKILTPVQLKSEKEQQRQQFLTTNSSNSNSSNSNTDETLYAENLLCGGEIKHLQKISVAASAHTATKAIFAASTSNINNNNKNIENQYIKPKLIDEKRPKSVTASVFTPILQLVNKQNPQAIVKLPTTTTTSTLQTIKPLNSQQQERLKQKTQIMNQEFFTYNQNAAKLTMLKEDPDDLSQLESNAAVDECRTLDETAPLFNDMLAGLMSSYDELLSDEINSLDSNASSIADVVSIDAQIFNNNNNDNNQRNRNNITTAIANIGSIETNVNNKTQTNNNGKFNNLNNEKHGHIDPFINYRDESNDTNHSQHLSSLTVTSMSPEGSSLPSLCSPHSVSQDDEFAFMTMNVDDEIDLTMRAPYIPMNEQDDLPLLTADDLMWCDNNTFTTDELNIKDSDVMQIELNDTQLQQQQQQQLQQQQRMQTCNLNNLLTYQQLQQQQQQQQQQHQQYLLQQQQEQLQIENTLSHVHRLHEIDQQALLQQQLQTDSSELATLLCGAGNVNTLSSLLDNCNAGNNTEQQFWNNTLRMQQQQQQQQTGNNITNDCKKNSTSNGTCAAGDGLDDVYEQIYNKESANLDCWNDLLQMNGQDVAINNGDTESVPLLLEQRKLPLLAPLSSQQQQQQQHILMNEEKNKSILNEKFLTTPMIAMRNKNVLEDLNVGNGFNLNKTTQQKQQQLVNLQQQPHGNKRQYSTTTTTTTNKSHDLREGEAKRIKNTNEKTKAATTQLLHHLMANTTNKQQQTVASTTATAQVIQLKNNKQKTNITHKPMAGPTVLQQQQQKQHKTNSVLKNLLVSGCDTIAPIKDEILTQENLVIAPNTENAFNLNAQAINSIMINASHNPLIGGTDIRKEDSSLTSPLSGNIVLSVDKNAADLPIYTFNKNIWPKAAKGLIDPLKTQGNTEINNKDAGPFIMDLCENDYAIQSDPFLNQVDIELAINEWSQAIN